ncbi:hypothetical protein Ahy_A07g031253 [Arachis hypogaea]|uniref:Uncharacterized protein n=1 Tax=Arachis hypogaea TaxID=3818 RepID=A0A445C3D1_ARAHY|nr:hypothetical protein Ahy_A07g031253 [Arachis hypogaea]
MKEKICVDKDAYVEGNSDVEVDFGKVGTDKNDDYDAYDPGTDSDGISCVHACAAISRVNKWPEDFCHKLLTMESYKATYSHHINSLPGQQLWERS